VDERLKINRDSWNEMVAVHAASPGYHLEQFKRGANVLCSIERDEVAQVANKSLLHLQCHFGLDTMSWARLGARVTGVDFSDTAIVLARSLSAELNIPATFVCTPVYDAPDVLHETFDIVFTSYGALCWLPDLTRWAQVIAHFLKPGGFFYIAEFHPFTQSYAQGPGVTRLEPQVSYFDTSPQEFPGGEPDYSDTSVTISHGSRCWIYTIGGVVSALIDAGLQIEFLHEFPVSCHRFWEFMEEDAQGWWRIKGDPIPLQFSIKARKPSRSH
jgi:SAM-dependent methyltransferase